MNYFGRRDRPLFDAAILNYTKWKNMRLLSIKTEDRIIGTFPSTLNDDEIWDLVVSLRRVGLIDEKTYIAIA